VSIPIWLFVVACMTVSFGAFLLGVAAGSFRPPKHGKREASCQCSHARCYHIFGASACAVASCACVKYIPKAADDELSKLREMAGMDGR
jgi:hypothetical protein